MFLAGQPPCKHRPVNVQIMPQAHMGCLTLPDPIPAAQKMNCSQLGDESFGFAKDGLADKNLFSKAPRSQPKFPEGQAQQAPLQA